MLVIGCGNRLRGDDAAGILTAERLRELGVPAQICGGEATALIETWEGAQDVIVIDAVVTGVLPGTLHIWDGRQPLPSCFSVASTHGLGVAEAIQLARVLDRLPARLRVWGIEAGQFDLASDVSPAVRQATEQAALDIAAEANALVAMSGDDQSGRTHQCH
jgi:hydrogenase maturation protease